MLGNLTIDPPAYITVFGRNIYLYGIVIGLGFLIAILFCSANAKKFSLKSDNVYDVILFVMPIGILGARAYYVAFQWDYYSLHPNELLAFWNGGLAIYGGIIAGAITLLIVCKVKKIKPFAMLDLIIMGLLIGQIFGRWGNFFNREAFGAETGIFCRMGLTDPSGNTIFVHPTFLYESLWNLCIFIFLCVLLKKNRRKYDGHFTLLYFLLYGIGRFWIEGLRTDSLYIGHTDIRVSQLLAAILVVFSGVMLIINRKKSFPQEITETAEKEV
ncbi:MAG: prolipoprotein diacylglyceryl transferase [Oscillospiraceae bacterium]|nr:prolipoprotein diacylglyceryl transferase [Oscillospiraceae bacterium]